MVESNANLDSMRHNLASAKNAHPAAKSAEQLLAEARKEISDLRSQLAEAWALAREYQKIALPIANRLVAPVEIDLFGQPLTPETPVVDLKRAFEEWWEIYPKGRKGSSKATFPKYEKAIKSGATPKQLLDAVKRYRNAGYVGSRFVLGPQVWLNGRHWEDEDIPLASDTPAGQALIQQAEKPIAAPSLDRTSDSAWRPIVKSWLVDGKWLSKHGLPPNKRGTQVPLSLRKEFNITAL